MRSARMCTHMPTMMQLASKHAHRTQFTHGHFSAQLEVRRLIRQLLRHRIRQPLHHLSRLRHPLHHLVRAMLGTAWPAPRVRCVLGASAAVTEPHARQQTTPSQVVLRPRHLIAQLQKLWCECTRVSEDDNAWAMAEQCLWLEYQLLEAELTLSNAGRLALAISFGATSFLRN